MASDVLEQKQVQLNCGVGIRLPHGWTHGPCPDDPQKSWCGPAQDESLTLFVSRLTKWNEGAQSGAKSQLESACISIQSVAQQYKTLSGVRVDDIEAGKLVFWEMESGQALDRKRSDTWYVLEEEGSQVHVTRYVLEYPADQAGHTRIRRAASLVAAQLPEKKPEIHKAVTFEVAGFKEQTFNEIVTWAHPENWSVHQHNDHTWVFIGGQSTPGCIWFSLDVKPLDLNAARVGSAFAVRQEAKAVLDKAKDQSKNFVMQDRFSIGDSTIVLWVEDEKTFDYSPIDAKLGPMRVFSWNYIKPKNEFVIIASFSLMLPIALAGSPHFMTFVRKIEDQIKAAQFGS